MPTGGGEFRAYGIGAAMADTDPAVQRRQEIRNGMLHPAWHQFRYPRPATDEPTPGFRRAIEVCVDSAAVREAALQARLDAVLAVCDAAEHQATRWEQPFPVPAWVTDVRAAAEGRDGDA